MAAYIRFSRVANNVGVSPNGCGFIPLKEPVSKITKKVSEESLVPKKKTPVVKPKKSSIPYFSYKIGHSSKNFSTGPFPLYSVQVSIQNGSIVASGMRNPFGTDFRHFSSHIGEKNGKKFFISDKKIIKDCSECKNKGRVACPFCQGTGNVQYLEELDDGTTKPSEHIYECDHCYNGRVLCFTCKGFSTKDDEVPLL